MVVKLIKSEDLETLEKEINEFEEECFQQFKSSLPASINPAKHEWSLHKFRYNIKVVPGYPRPSDWRYHERPYFVAVIQY